MAEYRTNDLFRPGPIPQMNACVGENGGPYDFFDYAWGFYDAAEASIDAAIEHKAPLDVLVYPIVFCYRHAIELSLKHLGRVLPRLWADTGAVPLTHKLSDVWTSVTAYLQRSQHFDPDGTLVPMVDRVLRDVLEFDIDGTVFRYPESRAGTPHLQDARIINVLVLRDAMREVREAFKHWDRIASAIEEHGE
jgi:hypothetical protein